MGYSTPYFFTNQQNMGQRPTRMRQIVDITVQSNGGSQNESQRKQSRITNDYIPQESPAILHGMIIGRYIT